MEKASVLVLLRVVAVLNHMYPQNLIKVKDANSVSNVIEKRILIVNLQLYTQLMGFASIKNTTHFIAMVGTGHTFLGTNKRRLSIGLQNLFRDLLSLLTKTRKEL